MSWNPTLPVLAAVLSFSAALAGCGGARTEADLNAAFARIQIEEARIEHASGAPCEERDGACAEICDAARALCEVAEPTEDRDARTRCDRARTRCETCPTSDPCGGETE
jgi:hypothetical protein